MQKLPGFPPLPPPPPPRFGGKEGKREVFTSFSHPTRRQGPRTLNPKPQARNPKPETLTPDPVRV